ncbi:MAG: hypothetical protein KC636_23210, partial [Myxococcales bacterium]|nr:hypothetical protein [Myxococcales bacterium]
MSEAVLLLLCVAGCVTLVAAPLPSSELVDPKSPRARSARGSERRLAYTLLALASFVFLTLYAWSRGADWRAVGYLALLMTVSIVLIHPWLLVRGLLIPLGQVRMAHALSRLGGYPWLRDEAGGAALAGALALLRRGHDPTLAEWLEEQIAAAPLGGAGLAAAGLIAASRDDVAGARALLESVEAIDVDLTPRTAWRVAIDWRVADAIGRGAYDEALTIGRTGLPPSRTTDFMLLAAARLAGEYVESEALIKRWLWAPRRLQTFGLLRRALAGVPAPDAIPTPALPTFSLGAGRLAANDGGPPCSAALSLHVEVLADRDASPAAIRRLSRAWDRDLASPRLREALSRRVLDLRAPLAAEELLVDLREQCVEDLAALLRDRALELEAL